MATKKKAASTEKGAESVEALMVALNHPLKKEVQALRDVIRGASGRVKERVKWNAPSYHVDGEDLGAFNLRKQEFVMLVLLFPRGLVEDPDGLLEGSWPDRRTAHFHSMADVKKRQASLSKLIQDMVARSAA